MPESHRSSRHAVKPVTRDGSSGTVDQVVDHAQDFAREANNSRIVEYGARAGYAASGLVHLLIAWLAVRIALGNKHVSADQSGAMGALAASGPGRVLLIVVGAAVILLGLWQLFEAIGGRDTGERLKAAAKFVAYVALGWSALAFVRKAGTSSAKQSTDVTRTLMSWPGGVWIVGLVGLVVIGVGGYHIYKGAKKRFLHDLVEHPGRLAEVSGMIGYIAKGLAFIVVGILFIVAAADHKPQDARGLDGALKALLTLPFGQVLLVAVGLGFAAYAVYSFFRARHARV